MNSILILFGFGFFGLPLSINGAPGESSHQTETSYKQALIKHGHTVELVADMSEKGEPINDALQTFEFLGYGDVCFVFRGVRLEDNKSVAIKFINNKNAEFAKKEYKIYSYMKAINITDVEKYGIPTVYYYGKWENFIVTAYTYFDESLAYRSKLGTTTYDILFIIQQFIKQAKYMHSCGVRHDDIRAENILVRNCQSFIIDYNYGSKMMKDNRGGSILMAPLRYHQKRKRVPMDDFESFLYTICFITDVIRLDWFSGIVSAEIRINRSAAKQKIARFKANRPKIINDIKLGLSGLPRFQSVFVELAKEVFSGRLIPCYDKLYKMVTDALSELFPTRKCFSWVPTNTNVTHQAAVEKSMVDMHAINIIDIRIPESFEEYQMFEYPPVDETIFQQSL